MPSVTNTVYREHNVTNMPGNYGTAKDDHAPVGNVTSSGWRYRDLMRFGVSGPPAGAKVVSCILKLKTTSGTHSSQGSSPRIRIRRCTEDWAASGGGTEQWRSDADPVGFSVSTSATGEVSYSFGGANQTVYDFDITDYYEYVMSSSVFRRDGTPGGGLTNYGIEIRAGTISPSDETNTNDRCEFYSIRGSYAPRAVITWTVPDDATAPTLVAPNGVQSAAPTTFSFLFPSGDGARQYELEVGTALDTSNLWNPAVATVTAGTQKDVTYAGSAIPADGSTVYWRVRGLNEVGTAGPWSHGTFSVQSAPTVTLQSSVMAEVHNLGSLATWTGAEGKARIKATYTHPQSLNAAAWEVEVNGVVTAFPGGTLPGGVATFDLATGWTRNTNYAVRVRAQGTAGQWSAWTAVQNLRINWSQGIYTFTYPANATGWVPRHSALTTDASKTKVAYMYRNTSGPGAWQNTPAAATTSTSTSMDMLVRLSSFDPALNPTLPTAKLEWAPPGTGGTLDHWQVTGGGAIVVDEAVRRFGVHSVKVIPGATSGWIRNSRGVALTAGQWYTMSAYINTNGAVFGGQGCALGFNTEAGAYLPPLGVGTGALAPAKSTVEGTDGWLRLYDQFLIPGTPGDTVYLKPALWWGNGSTVPYFNVDAFQLEEGEIATGWKPGMAGPAVVMDVGGIAVDARLGGILRLYGSTGGLRDIIELYQKGLRFSDTELSSPSTGVLAANNVPLSLNTHTHAPYVPSTTILGASTRVAGTAQSPTVNTLTEYRHGAPAAGEDPNGFYQAGNGRLIIPAGMGGLYLYDVWMTGTAPVGTTSGQFAYAVAHLNLVTAAVVETIMRWDRFDSGAEQGAHGQVLRVLAAGETLFINAHARIAAATSIRVSGWSLVRIATAVA